MKYYQSDYNTGILFGPDYQPNSLNLFPRNAIYKLNMDSLDLSQEQSLNEVPHKSLALKFPIAWLKTTNTSEQIEKESSDSSSISPQIPVRKVRIKSEV